MSRNLTVNSLHELRLWGEVVFCPRPKINRGTGRAYYPQSYIDFKRRAALQLRLQWKQAPIEEALDIKLVLMFKKPKSRLRKRTAHLRTIRSHSRGDLDNAVKSVIDALQEAEIIKNDNQLFRLQAEMWFCAEGEEPFTSIHISTVKDGTWRSV